MAACTAGALVIRCGGSRSPVSRGFVRAPKVCMQIPVPQQQQHSIAQTMQKKLQEISENRMLRNAAFGALNFLMFNLPLGMALAEEEVEEKGKIFDFNGTLPFIAAEILFLTWFLEKFFFTPVIQHIEDRDYIIKKMSDDGDREEKRAEELKAEIEATLVAAKAEAVALYEQKEDKYRRMYEETARRLKQERLRNIAVVREKIKEEVEAEIKSAKHAEETKALAKMLMSKLLPDQTPQEKIDQFVANAPIPSMEEAESANYIPKPPPVY